MAKSLLIKTLRYQNVHKSFVKHLVQTAIAKALTSLTCMTIIFTDSKNLQTLTESSARNMQVKSWPEN